MLSWKLNQNLSSVYFLRAKFQLVSCNLSLPMIWQMTYTHKLPKLCLATLKCPYLQGLTVVSLFNILYGYLIRFSLSICFDLPNYSQTPLIQTLRGSYTVSVLQGVLIKQVEFRENGKGSKSCCRTKGFLNCVQIFN